MADTSFQSFIAGGLVVLIAAVIFLTWMAWRYLDRQRDMEALALAGVGHELSHVLQRLTVELGLLSRGEATGAGDLLPIVHPQLDALIAQPSLADRRAIAVIRAAYEELAARKLDIRATLAQGKDVSRPLNEAANALLETIGTLYLWEKHGGKAPKEAPSTRTWDVRAWMVDHGFDKNALPGIHLRDEVVERLRSFGMTLTPKPLTHSASEYYAKRYRRKADPNGPFGQRRSAPQGGSDGEQQPLVEAPETGGPNGSL
ncbi:MAG: hypothetical protein AAGF20_13660 [Pseudomonadota bacterium]